MSLIADHVFYSYGMGSVFETQAVRDVSIKIEDGQMLGIIGHTGSGKSTFIQMLNGLVRPVSGHIFFNGADIFDPEYDRRKLRTRVGLVFQYPEYQLFDSTVLKDVSFGPKNQGLSENEALLRAYKALKSVGMDEKLFDASPFELSGGQKRRAALAGVLAMEPDFLILDEPTAGLDPKGRYELLDMISEIHRERNMGVVLVSHNMDDIAAYVDRILVMCDGAAALYGSVQEVFEHADELISYGLDIPQATSILKKLQNMGLGIDTDAYTPEEAAVKIAEALKYDAGYNHRTILSD